MKKISKRIIALMLASSMVVSMTACGKKDSNTTGTETPVANTESTVDGSALAADALVFDATADAATANGYDDAVSANDGHAADAKCTCRSCHAADAKCIC